MAGLCENVKLLDIHKVWGICRPAEENVTFKGRILHNGVSLVA